MIPRSQQPHPRPALSTSLSRIVLLVICLLSLVSWVTVRASGQQAPVFRARTELVRLDVTITGDDGRPVGDVRPEEIEITENGRVRPVILLRHLAPQHDAAGASARFEEVSENFASASGRLYVLVFDQLHIPVGGEQRIRDAAERFLSHTVQKGDAVAVYALPGPGPRLALTGDFMKVRLRLMDLHGRAARAASAASGIDETPGMPGATALDDSVVGVDSVSANEIARAREAESASRADTQTHIFLSQLGTVMRSLGDIDGRKSVILFSEGFSADMLGPQFEDVTSAAAQSHSCIFPVDVSAASVRPGAVARRDALVRLALDTNGRVLGDLGTLDRTLSEVAAHADDYYLVGFEPGTSEGTRQYHPVKVKVTRRGLVARARSGYWSAPAATPTDDRRAIDVALSVPRPTSALPVQYTTYERVGPAPDKPRIIASITAYVPQASCVGNADVVFVVRDVTTGQAVASGTDQVRLQAVQGDAPAVLEPISYAVQFDVPPGDYWMRVLVREPGGVIGTADRRLHVWPLAGPSLATSDLIVASLHGARFDAPTQAEVHPQDEVLAYAEVYGSSDALKDADAKVEVGRADSGEIVATLDPVVKAATTGARILRARLPVAALSEGRYFARVRVVAPNQAAKTIMRYFRIVGPPLGKPHTDN